MLKSQKILQLHKLLNDEKQSVCTHKPCIEWAYCVWLLESASAQAKSLYINHIAHESAESLAS